MIAEHMNHAALTTGHWASIDHVLLDLDGTLLDLDFDNHFWQNLVPEVWGAARGLDPDAARAALRPRFMAIAGTLPWYSSVYWARELQLDIHALTRQDSGRVRWLPGAQRFLRAARAHGKTLVLLTNSDPFVLAIKDERAGVLAHFDAAHSSHDFGAPKEDPRFWQALRAALHFDPARSLFVDDTSSVLRAAGAAGVGLIRAIRRPDSARAAHAHEEFEAVDALVDLLPPE
jgi:putative hydrolase of the HAD superfamily